MEREVDHPDPGLEKFLRNIVREEKRSTGELDLTRSLMDWGKTMAASGFVITKMEPGKPTGMLDFYWGRRSVLGSISGWIELKHETRVIRPEQRLFIQDLCKMGVKSWIIVQEGTVCHVFLPRSVEASTSISGHPVFSFGKDDSDWAWGSFFYFLTTRS